MREFNLAVEVIQADGRGVPTTMEITRVAELLLLSESREQTLRNLDGAQELAGARAQGRTKTHGLTEGDYVLKLNMRRFKKKEAGAKFLPCWEDPYILNTLHENGSATISDAYTFAQLPRIGVQHLGRFLSMTHGAGLPLSSIF